MGKRFECEFCEYSASRKEYLTNHVEKKHADELKDDEDEEFTCDVCHFVADDEDQLMDHLNDNHVSIKGQEAVTISSGDDEENDEEMEQAKDDEGFDGEDQEDQGNPTGHTCKGIYCSRAGIHVP